MKRTRKNRNYTNKKRTKSKEYYNDKNGMMTYIWGPPLWHFLHTMSFNYPVNPTDKDKEYYRNFIKSMGKILPCKYCRDNYKINLKNVPINQTALKNRENFSKWMFNFHNEINKQLKKPIHKNYNEVRDLYETFRARCGKDNQKIELGCTDPVNKIKKKCVLFIIPKNHKCKSFNCY
tara:strand:- start:1752 stop:2282 length:531 start_codon:yes stop_codon:yes gene_type:complete